MKIFTPILLLVFLNQSARATGRESGGGDIYTLDFTRIASEFIYPWLQDNGLKLTPPVDAEDFLEQVSPLGMSSTDHVFESCDGTNRGREVDICYNAARNSFVISRTRYPLADTSAMKVRLIAHEIFRKMGIEGDLYEISKQMSLLDANSPYIPGPRVECASEVTMSLEFVNQGKTFNVRSIAKANRGNPRTKTCSYRAYSTSSSLGPARAVGLIDIRGDQLRANLIFGKTNIQVQVTQISALRGRAVLVKSWSPQDIANPLQAAELNTSSSSIEISSLKSRVPVSQN